MDSINLDELLEESIPDALFYEFCELEIHSSNQKYLHSDSYYEKIQTLLNHPIQTNHIPTHNVISIKKRLPLRYLLIAILLMILCSLPVLATEPLKEALEKITYTVFPSSISLDPNSNSESSQKRDIIWKAPSYIPKGYHLHLENYDIDTRDSTLIWKDIEGNSLFFKQYEPHTTGATVTSDGSKPVDVRIGPYFGKMITDQDNFRTLFYEQDGYVYLLTGTIDTDEIIKIMENIK